MSGDHTHTHSVAAWAGGGYRRRLVVAFALIAFFFVVEVVAGFLTNSLALLSDAGHMFTDVIGIGMALAAVQLISRDARVNARAGPRHRTFGLYRVEILAAFINALLLFGVAIFVLVEAVRRLSSQPDVHGLPLLIVGSLGLVVNLFVLGLLRSGAGRSLNVEGAYLEVFADALGSIGVIVAAVAIQTVGWTWVDPLMAAAIGVFILPRTWRLGRKAVRILIQAAPRHLDLERIEAELREIPDVVDVHDLHVWTLTSQMDAASAHLMVCVGADNHAVLDQARHLLADRHAIEHATLQVEPDDHVGCDGVGW